MLSDDYTLHTDKQRVQLILEELLNNANKFTQQGTITVSCGQKDQQMVTIRVSDTGIGIAKTDRKNIFTQFVKIDLFTEGVGLGLPLSKRAAQRIGGDLVLDEAYDQGAAFVLTIPINI
jgi:signal transduction histidine kinase